MNGKNNKNEGIGIIAIIIIVILAGVGLYYFFSHRPGVTTENNVPLEAPAPIKGSME